MKYMAIFIAATLFSSAVFCEDPGDTKRPRRESEDPSYEPQRGSAGRAPRSKVTTPAADTVIDAVPSSVQSNRSQPVVEVQTTAGPRVKYIVDGKPVYEGDPPVPGIDDTKLGLEALRTREKGAAVPRAAYPLFPKTGSEAPAPQPVEVQEAAGPRVKYILNGKPVYEGDPAIAEIEGKKEEKKEEKKSVWSFLKKKEPAAAPRAPDASVEVISDVAAPSVPGVPAAPGQVQSGPRVKYILDGKPIYEGEEPPAPGVAQNGVPVSPIIEAQPTSRQTPSAEDDVTADKGTAAAQRNVSLLDDYVGGEHLNTRAQNCYKLLAELKTNVETVSRCLDKRGEENARLIHKADDMAKNITDLSDIWPGAPDYIERCTATKRYALLFNDELSQSPWKWAQVRWSFDAFLKDVRVFREYAKVMADLELKQQPKKDAKGQLVHLKTGELVWEDVPDPTIDPLAAKKEADQKAKREELARIRKGAELRTEAQKNQMDVDLRNAPQGRR